MLLIFLILASFIAAGIVGARYYRSSVWDWIDTVYFPLSAIAILLFFASNDVRHQFLDVRQTLLTKRIGTNNAQAERLGLPKLRAVLGPDLRAPRFTGIHEITAFARACESSPDPDSAMTLLSDPAEECPAARRYLPALSEFEENTRGVVRTEPYLIVDKLHADCQAAGTLVESIRGGGLVSGPVAEDMASTYQQLRKTGVDPARFQADAMPLIRAHVKRNKTYSEALRRTSEMELSARSREDLEIRSHEADLSGKILTGLLPCVVLAPTEFESLQTVLHKDSLFKVRMERLDYLQTVWQKKRAQVNTHTVFGWIQLGLWPYLLAFAVSLKLARLVATMRRDGVR
jgi:hypothetical protein